MSKLFDQALSKVTPGIKQFVDNSIEIADQIHAVLESKNKSQKELADLLGKSESEVSKWLTGTHNFTLKSISKIEAALGEKIIITPLQSRRDFLQRMENATPVLDGQNKYYVSVEGINPIWSQFASKGQRIEPELTLIHTQGAGENNYDMAA